MNYLWHLRNPDGASMGLEFAYARSGKVDVVLAHALPERINVEVREESDALIARAENLQGQIDSPIARLTIVGGSVQRENIWPTDADVGLPVLLPGGEVGVLLGWWNAPDRSEWRWQIELWNSVRD